jgi:hypothetical protein
MSSVLNYKEKEGDGWGEEDRSSFFVKGYGIMSCCLFPPA